MRNKIIEFIITWYILYTSLLGFISLVGEVHYLLQLLYCFIVLGLLTIVAILNKKDDNV